VTKFRPPIGSLSDWRRLAPEWRATALNEPYRCGLRRGELLNGYRRMLVSGIAEQAQIFMADDNIGNPGAPATHVR
jgi:hypothetical protein